MQVAREIRATMGMRGLVRGLIWAAHAMCAVCAVGGGRLFITLPGGGLDETQKDGFFLKKMTS